MGRVYHAPLRVAFWLHGGGVEGAVSLIIAPCGAIIFNVECYSALSLNIRLTPSGRYNKKGGSRAQAVLLEEGAGVGLQAAGRGKNFPALN